MGGADEVDIMATLGLEMEHHEGHFFRFYLPALAQLADLVVLTKLASQVAPGEEDGPRAMIPHQGRLLAEMGVVTGNHGPLPGAASGPFGAQKPIGATFPRANSTLLQASVGFLGPPFQLAGAT